MTSRSIDESLIAPAWQAVPRAMWALCLRELRKAARQKARLISGVAQPLLYFLALGAGLDSVFSAAGYGKYTHFISPGIITMGLMTPAFVGGVAILWDRKLGFLKETLVSPASRSAIAVGRASGIAAVSTLQGAFLLLVAKLLGVPLPMGVMLLAAIAVMFLIGIVFSLAGTIAGLIIEDFQNIQLIVTFILMPLFFFSGALFPIHTGAGLSTLDLLVRINPLTYCVDLLRHALDLSGYFSVPFDLGTVGFLTVVSASIASLLMRRTDLS